MEGTTRPAVTSIANVASVTLAAAKEKAWTPRCVSGTLKEHVALLGGSGQSPTMGASACTRRRRAPPVLVSVALAETRKKSPA